MHRAGPALLAAGALLLIAGLAGHSGIVWAAGVVLAAAGAAVLLARRSRVAGVALALVLIGGLGVYPWLAARSATEGQARWDVRTGSVLVGLSAAGGRVLERDDNVVRLLDARTGEELTEVRIPADNAAQGLDGSFYVAANDTFSAYDREGRRRWSRPGGFAGAVAAAGGTVLVAGCERGRCGVHAIDAQGRERWTRRADARLIGLPGQVPGRESASTPRLLSDVALVSGPDDTDVALDARDGRVLGRGRQSGFNTVAPGRALLQTRLSERECRLEILARSGRRAAPQAGCGPAGGLATRAYVASVFTGLATIDLRTGRTRRVAGARVSGTPPLTVGGESVVVRRSGQRLTAQDAATGKRLWSREFSGGRPPSMSIAGGIVTVIAEPHALNPFRADDGDELTVLGARTGEERASLVVTAGIRATVALGEDRVLAVGKDGVHRVAGR